MSLLRKLKPKNPFRSRRVVTLDVATIPLIDEKTSIIQQANAVTLVSGVGFLPAFNSLMMDSLALRANQFFSRSKNNSQIGLPEVDWYTLETEDKESVESELRAYLEYPTGTLVIDWILLGDTDSNFLGLDYCFQELNLNFETNQINDPDPDPVNPRQGSFFYVGSVFITNNAIRLGYVWKYTDNTGTEQEEELDVLVPYQSVQNTMYTFVQYRLDGIYGLWRTEGGSGEVSEPITDKEYFPFFEIKRTDTTILDESQAGLLAQYERALRPLNFSLREVAESILDDSDPDDQVDLMNDVFFHFGLDIFTETKGGKEYLYRYFEYLESKQITDKATYETWQNVAIQQPRTEFTDSLVNNIRVAQNGYDINLAFNYIDSYVINETQTEQVTTEFIANEPLAGVMLFKVLYGMQVYTGVDRSILKIKKRINDTQVKVIEVHGLVHAHNIEGEGVVIQTLTGSIRARNENSTGKKQSFFLPLSHTIAKTVPLLMRDELYQESLVVTIYTKQITKVRFWQTRTFRIILYVVAIIYIVYTGDFSNATAALKTLLNAAITLAVTKFVIMPLLIKAVDILGIESSAIIAFLLTAAAIFTGNAALAKDLLYMAHLTFQAVAEVAKNILEALQEELELLFDAMKEFQDEIDEINDALGKGNINYLLEAVQQHYFNPNETPDMFFYRTINEQNPGVRALEYVESFVANKLELPKVDYNFAHTHLRGELI